VTAVQSLCRDVSRRSAVYVTFTHGVLLAPIDPTIALCLYRIAQEALHNVVRHSGAHQAEVQLAHDADSLLLQIADSGVGFDAQDTSHAGLGLLSMRERVAFLRGQLAIHARRGAGTRISVRVPAVPPARGSQVAIPRSA
jgi:signal transduction histidine kinase